MTIDYDVVIIGGSLAGHSAALAATQLHATVALVEPKINHGLIHHHTLNEIGKMVQQLHNAVNLGIHPSQANTIPEIYLNGATPPTPASSEKSPISTDWSKVMLSSQGIVSNLAELNSPANLAALGVDVIFGNGQFHSSPQLAFAVSDAYDGLRQRLLHARTYLLAGGSSPAIPKIDGLQATGYLTLANIWQSLKEPNPPQNWVIMGGVPQSIEIAQSLAQLGYSVTLIVKHPYILSSIDPEIAQLLQAQLEVDGVRVLTQTSVTQVRRIEGKKWIQAGDKAIETDEILIVTKQQPNLESLNLAAVGVKWHQQRLLVNDKLQTTNRRIYACGDVIGGYDLANIANYEASIALKNALFFPRTAVNYQCIPWAVFTQPMLGQVGLTEAQAKDQFSQDKVLVLRKYFKSVTASQLRSEITGICKIIVLENGEILGATILGAEAAELINLIALAMSRKIPVKHLASLFPAYPSFSEIIEQTAGEWSKQRLNRNTALQDLLEDFFQFRRDWNL
ncbi:dihydrolipoyl dehydrogenase family protein [Cylindrospermum sp. FACHB-282]|uniref:dihydrolipoyl dehydrogenase family protein n=1 Tax=Cylindrospermum sp. FACHB-282 TaxID=2692794 RepID=UPI0016869EE5|nr:NAD(P)/FAD-dependent oxidoreductase [Cylindrospermum sp. FACHB-282]MBD2387758.1 NAD(P)/FAD-dependent oxidoreductase [Cylindrospermum sp. FACHB-282]